MAQHYGPNIVTDGLVLSLDAADKNSYPGSGTTWTDLSGNGNNGTLSNSTIGTDTPGDMHFDGSTDYIQIDKTDFQMGTTEEITAACWVNFDAAASYKGLIFNGGGGGGNGWGLMLNSNENFRVEIMGADNARNTFTPDFGYTTGTWFYLAAAFKRTKIITYKNGVLNYTSGAFSDPGAITNGSTHLYLGTHNNNAWFFDGKMRIVQIWGRELTAAEILQNFNVHRSRFSV